MCNKNVNVFSYLFSHTDSNGLCAKAVLDTNGIVWSKTSCSDSTGKGYVCQRRQNVEEIGEFPFFVKIIIILFTVLLIILTP